MDDFKFFLGYRNRANILSGFRTRTIMEPGIIYAPYIPLMMTPQDNTNPSRTERNLNNHYSRPVNENYYGTIHINDMIKNFKFFRGGGVKRKTSRLPEPIRIVPARRTTTRNNYTITTRYREDTFEPMTIIETTSGKTYPINWIGQTAIVDENNGHLMVTKSYGTNSLIDFLENTCGMSNNQGVFVELYVHTLDFHTGGRENFTRFTMDNITYGHNPITSSLIEEPAVIRCIIRRNENGVHR